MTMSAAVETEPARALLAVNNIEVIYDHVILVLKGVSLHVHEGCIVALLGANGAGKTTLVRSLNATVLLSSGEIVIDGPTLANIYLVRQPRFSVMPLTKHEYEEILSMSRCSSRRRCTASSVQSRQRK